MVYVIYPNLGNLTKKKQHNLSANEVLTELKQKNKK